MIVENMVVASEGINNIMQCSVQYSNRTRRIPTRRFDSKNVMCNIKLGACLKVTRAHVQLLLKKGKKKNYAIG